MFGTLAAKVCLTNWPHLMEKVSNNEPKIRIGKEAGWLAGKSGFWMVGGSNVVAVFYLELAFHVIM